MRFDRNGKLEFAGMPPRAMRAGAVWYRYTIGYRSVSLPNTVGAVKLEFGGDAPAGNACGGGLVSLHHWVLLGIVTQYRRGRCPHRPFRKCYEFAEDLK